MVRFRSPVPSLGARFQFAEGAVERAQKMVMQLDYPRFKPAVIPAIEQEPNRNHQCGNTSDREQLPKGNGGLDPHGLRSSVIFRYFSTTFSSIQPASRFLDVNQRNKQPVRV